MQTGGEEERAFAHRHFSYLGRSRYVAQIERLHQHFSAEQLLVIESERLFTDPRQTMERSFAHLGLAPHAQASYPAHKALRPGAVPAASAEWLRERLAPDRPRLVEILGFEPVWT